MSDEDKEQDLRRAAKDAARKGRNHGAEILEKDLAQVSAKLAIEEAEAELKLPDVPKTQDEIGDKSKDGLRSKRIETLNKQRDILTRAIARLLKG